MHGHEETGNAHCSGWPDWHPTRYKFSTHDNGPCLKDVPYAFVVVDEREAEVVFAEGSGVVVQSQGADWPLLEVCVPGVDATPAAVLEENVAVLHHIAHTEG